MRVGIIGGGAAGLAAAYELSKHGHTPVVYERAPFLGGQASTFDVGGARLERGYHHLFRSDRDMAHLMGELGLGPRLAWLPSSVGLFHGGRLWPFGTPTDLLRFSPLPFLDRVRLGVAALWLQRRQDWRRLERQPAHQMLPRLVGQRAYQVFWEPMLRGKFGTRYQEISMAWLWEKVYLRFAGRGRSLGREKLGYPVGSFAEIFEALEAAITRQGGQVYTGAAVHRVTVEEGRATGLEVEVPGRGAVQEAFDAVVATVPSFVFTRLVPPLPQDYMERLTGVSYLAAVLAVLVLDRPLSRYYWMNIADRSIPFVGVIEQTNFMPPEHYGGNHIVYLSNYLGKESPYYHMKPDELLEAYVPSLQRLNPAFQMAWVREYHYHREEAAQPVIGVDYSHRIPTHHTPIRDLYLANTTQVYPEDRGTNYSVRLGRKVARLLMADHGQVVDTPLPRAAIPDSVTVAMKE